MACSLNNRLLIPKNNKQMNRFSLFVLMLAALFWAGCQNDDDDNGCASYEVEWQTPVLIGNINWVFLADESGKILQQARAGSQESYTLSLTGCDRPASLTFLSARTETVNDESSLRDEIVIELTTVLRPPSGLRWDTLAQQPTTDWAIAVANVSSLEDLRWPAENSDVFQGDIFLDPAADLLSFNIQVPEGQPVFLSIRANNETTPRGIWVPSTELGQLSFDYNELLPLTEQGPVGLPNLALWRYFIYGEGPSGQSLVDFPVQPDFVTGEFRPSLPSEGPEGLRMRMEEAREFRSYPYLVHVYDESGLPSLPASFDLLESLSSTDRSGDTLRVSVLDPAPTVYKLELVDYRGIGPWLRWTIYGSPEDMASFVLPDWTEGLENIRQSTLAPGRQTLALLTIKQYGSGAAYEQFVEALFRKDTDWEARQRLVQRTNASQY